jgi:hypothetical protein
MKRQLLLATSLILASGVAYAATQGAAGTSSTGSVDLTLSMQQRVIVERLNNILIDATAWDGSSDVLSTAEDFCVGQNLGFAVDVTFTSANGTAPAFTAQDGAANAVDYNVYFKNGTGALTTDSQVSSGTPETGVAMATQQNLGCAADNASIIVEFLGTDLQAASSNGTDYTDTITVLVAPN